MKRLTKFKNVLLTILVLCFVACDPDDEIRRNTNTETNTTVTDTTDSGEDTIVVVEPVVTSDICLECGENFVENYGYWFSNYSSTTIGRPINDTLDIVCLLYRVGNYYLLNGSYLCASASKLNDLVFGMICNQNQKKTDLDYIWNNYPSTGRSHGWEYKTVRLKGIWSFIITNKSDYEGPIGEIEVSKSSKHYYNIYTYYGVKILDIEYTEEDFRWKQGDINLEWYDDQVLGYYHPYEPQKVYK
ncbi:MAG: hypothetical protein MJZ71_02415 [Bacteroidales bacterium]|nr:hypothetical protein [Bacteroidales bacterium]